MVFMVRRCIGPLTIALAALVVLTPLGASGADDKKSKDREMARRVQALQQEKAEIAAKLKEADSKTADLSKTVEDTKRGAERSAREAAATKKALAEATARADKLVEELKALQARFDETSLALGRREKEKRMLEDVAAEQVAVMGRQSRLIDTCRAGNGELYRIGAELLGQLHSERNRYSMPLLGFSLVDEYNADQEIRDKLDRNRMVDPQ